MARNWIMGDYYCNLNHKHSSHSEVEQCNYAEVAKSKHEYSLRKDAIKNDRLKQKNKHRKLELEEQREKNRHEEQMARYESERNTKSKVCNVL